MTQSNYWILSWFFGTLKLVHQLSFPWWWPYNSKFHLQVSPTGYQLSFNVLPVRLCQAACHYGTTCNNLALCNSCWVQQYFDSLGLQVTQFHCQVQAAVASSNKWNIIETTHHVKFHLTGLASFLALRVRELCVKKHVCGENGVLQVMNICIRFDPGDCRASGP